MIYQASGIQPEKEMDWKQWVGALMIFSVAKIVIVFLICSSKTISRSTPKTFLECRGIWR